jgi:hypothetical protein
VRNRAFLSAGCAVLVRAPLSSWLLGGGRAKSRGARRFTTGRATLVGRVGARHTIDLRIASSMTILTPKEPPTPPASHRPTMAMSLPLKPATPSLSHGRRSARFSKEQQKRKDVVATPEQVSADGGGILFSEWLEQHNTPSSPAASARRSKERPSPVSSASSSAPAAGREGTTTTTTSSSHDRRSLHRQATTQPDSISRGIEVALAPTSTNAHTMAAASLAAADGRMQSEAAAGIASMPAKYSDPLSWAPKAAPRDGQPEAADVSAAAGMVALGLRRASSQHMDHAASVVRAHPANPVGWTDAAHDAPPQQRDAKLGARGGFGDISHPAVGVVRQAGSQWDPQRETVAAALVDAGHEGSGSGAAGTAAEACQPRRVVELTTQSASEGAITMDQWLSARQGSARSAPKSSPRDRAPPSSARTPPSHSGPHDDNGMGGAASGGRGDERPSAERRHPRPFAHVNSATDWIMFEGNSTPGRSMAAARASMVDISDGDAGGARAAGVPSGNVQSYINPVTWCARETAGAASPHAADSAERRTLHREETGLLRRGLPPNTSSPTRT